MVMGHFLGHFVDKPQGPLGLCQVEHEHSQFPLWDTIDNSFGSVAGF